MHLYTIYCIIVVVLCGQLECRFHHRRNSHIHRQFRQNQQMNENPRQNFQAAYPVQPDLTQSSIYNPQPSSPDSSGSNPINSESPPPFQPLFSDSYSFGDGGSSPSFENSYTPPNSVAVPSDSIAPSSNVVSLPPPPPPPLPPPPPPQIITMPNAEFPPYSFTSGSSILSSSFANEMMPVPSLSPGGPEFFSTASKRRRKNVPEMNDDDDDIAELFQKGKELLKLPTLSEISSDNDYQKGVTVPIGNGTIDSYATIIPIPKGIRLKTDSKYHGKNSHTSANITSNTQNTLSFDNNTEIENVVEMQMEKDIEDDKGASKGSEEVRIIETERVKPVKKWNKKANSFTTRKKTSKGHRKRFVAHRRFKRSKFVAEESSRPKLLYDKMARRFLSVVKRKERVVEPSNLSYRHIVSNLRKLNRRVNTENIKKKDDDDDSVHNSDEINDFMKFVLKQMKKFRKSQESIKNDSEIFKRPCTKKLCSNFNIPQVKSKKLKANSEYPKHMSVNMNFNITWDSKVKKPKIEFIRLSEKQKSSTVTADEKTARYSEAITTQTPTVTVFYVPEKRESPFLKMVLVFSAITFIFTFLTVIVPKLCKMAKPNPANSTFKSYKLFDDFPNDKMKGLERQRLIIEEDYPKLEWQSENGDWLSEKESDLNEK